MVYQVKLSRTGKWHRRQLGNGDDHTACGLSITGAYLSREWALDQSLCPECFTDRERDTGEMKRIENDALAYARADDRAESWDRDPEEITTEIDPPPLDRPIVDADGDGGEEGSS